MALGKFVGAVWDSWVERVGIMLTVLALIELLPPVQRWLSNQPLLLSVTPFIWIAAGLFVVAGCYDAWRKEYRARLEAERQVSDLTKPNLVIEVGSAIYRYDPLEDETVCFLLARITNKGADSAVLNFRIRYTSRALDRVVKTTRLLGVQHFPFPKSSKSGKGLVMESTDAHSLMSNMGDPIRRGGFRMGRIPVVVPGNHIDEIQNEEALFTVAVSDYLGKWSEFQYRGKPGATAPEVLATEVVKEVEAPNVP